MNEETKNKESDLKGDEELACLSDGDKQKLISIMEKMLEMGIGAVYGQEAVEGADADVECGSRIHECRAKCCTFSFALTKEEVGRGQIKHNPLRPFFISRDENGYCTHLERDTFKCTVYEARPIRCRRYDCRKDSRVWPER
ncbi:MAG: YkgJ family cysteine cluster protein [Nitrospirota bacterium]